MPAVVPSDEMSAVALPDETPAVPPQDQPIVPSEKTLDAPPHVQQAAKRALESMLAGVSGDVSDEFGNYLARVFQKALETVDQEATEPASAHKTETEAAKKVGSGQMSGGIHGISDKGTASNDHPVNTSDSVQTAGSANETAAFSIEEPTTTVSESFTAAAGPTAGHIRIDSLDARMQSLSIHDAAPADTPVTGCNAGEASVESPQDKDNMGKAAQGVASSTAAVKLADDDDFWARSGIAW
jgi:hypothetical protein